MKFSFFTIGHSTRPIDEFIDLLTASEIGIVVDARCSALADKSAIQSRSAS